MIAADYPVTLARPGLLHLPRLLYRALRGETLFLLGTGSLQPFERLICPGIGFSRRFLLKFRNVKDVSDVDYRIEIASWYRDILLIADLFGRTEAWQDGYFGFSEIDRKLPDFARCYKATICASMQFRHLEIFAALCLQKKVSAGRLKFLGLDPDTRAAIEAVNGSTDNQSNGPARWRRSLNYIVNLPVALAVGAIGLVRLLRQIRFRPPAADTCFLMADYVSDPADRRLYDAAARIGPLVLVPRSPDYRVPDAIAEFEPVVSPRNNGIVPLSGLGRTGIDYARALIRIFGAIGWLRMPVFASAAAWPYKVAQNDALFRRYRPRAYFARDTYNPDHILRHSSLRKIGAHHIGLNIGYPCYSILFPTMRYIAFDTYLVYGTALYEKHYVDRWPTDMKMLPIGPFRLSPQQFAAIRQPRPENDIAVFAGAFVAEPGMVGFVRHLAAAFPKRRILLQVKPVFRDRPAGRRYIAECTEGFSNVIPVTDDVYDVLSRVRYSITDPSSIVVEALSLGIVSLLADVSRWQHSCYFRDHEEIVVRSGEEAVRRIKALENGTQRYPSERLSNVACRSDAYYVDRVTELLGTIAADSDRQGGDRK